MRAPLFAIVLAVLAGLLLAISAFLGVSNLADWTVFAAEISLVLAVIIFLGWFVAGCISEIRNA